MRLLAYGYDLTQCAAILGITVHEVTTKVDDVLRSTSSQSLAELLSVHNKMANEIDQTLQSINSKVIPITGGSTWQQKLIGFSNEDLKTNLKICEIIDDALAQGLQLDDDLRPIVVHPTVH